MTNRLGIGGVSSRSQVSPKFFFSSYSRLKNTPHPTISVSLAPVPRIYLSSPWISCRPSHSVHPFSLYAFALDVLNHPIDLYPNLYICKLYSSITICTRPARFDSWLVISITVTWKPGHSIGAEWYLLFGSDAVAKQRSRSMTDQSFLFLLELSMYCISTRSVLQWPSLVFFNSSRRKFRPGVMVETQGCIRRKTVSYTLHVRGVLGYAPINPLVFSSSVLVYVCM